VGPDTISKVDKPVERGNARGTHCALVKAHNEDSIEVISLQCPGWFMLATVLGYELAYIPVLSMIAIPNAPQTARSFSNWT
jgi:hypothetical protein